MKAQMITSGGTINTRLNSQFTAVASILFGCR